LYRWTFWLDSQKSKFTSKVDYEAGLQVIFCVETVQEFWSVFNNIPGKKKIYLINFIIKYFFKAPSRLANRVSYHLMRQNRKPLWEDRENEK